MLLMIDLRRANFGVLGKIKIVTDIPNNLQRRFLSISAVQRSLWIMRWNRENMRDGLRVLFC